MNESRHSTQHPVLAADRGVDATAGQRTTVWQREFAEAGGAFSQAFHYAAIGMAIVGLDGRFLKLNRSFCQIVGYDEAELLATDFQAITHADDLDIDVSLTHQLRDGQIDHYHLEKRYLHKSGSVIWVLLSVSMIRDEREQPCYFISQIQDITARKAAEIESQRRLRHLERLTYAASQLMRDLDSASDEEQYSTWLRILMKSFASPVGLFVRVNREDVLVGPYAMDSHEVRIRYRPGHRLDVWDEAIRTESVVAENVSRKMERGRVVRRSLVGAIIHEGSLAGILHLSDADVDYDDDDCDVLERVIRMIAPVVHARLQRDALTPREQEVMEMLVSGMSQKQIASTLEITVQTAAKHRARLLDKLQIKNDVELVHLAFRMRRPVAVPGE